ncbi:hypothetical protein AAFF_G00000530 [Aldrovandia affinis]|uniref:Gelsolin-like domain-containing protein n=1 Tax=Aldrovandia affinis TaxID=143900 RepID=A0AAD7TCS8_9TELE|nr:hypothetical protein AAFF_G00000530 [Aldrovandia affinis]
MERRHRGGGSLAGATRAANPLIECESNRHRNCTAKQHPHLRSSPSVNLQFFDATNPTMVCHKEFENAGKEPGLEIWRVENMDLKPVPKLLYGNFFSGDAYILLYTAPFLDQCIHMWIGNECSQDESGAASILVMQLDDHLGGKPVQVRNVQGSESPSFMGLFKNGIRYKKGGVASGFQHVVTNDMSEKRLLHVKGRRRIRAIEVDMSWDSFNKGDCFIIDLGENIYHWCGSECNGFERMKSCEVSLDIRDNERGGRAKVHIIDEGEEPQEVIDVLGPKPDIADQQSNDEAVERSSSKKATLYMISDATGSMKSTVVAKDTPFTQDQLSLDECYIVDNSKDDKIFLWKGKNAAKAERAAAMKAALQFIKEKNYSAGTEIIVMPAGAETTLFKQFFSDWKDKDETTGPTKPYCIGSIAQVEQVPFDASALHSNKTMAAHHCMVDDGSGEVQVWRIEKGDKVLVDPESYGQFYGGDCYLILYSYRQQKEEHIIYIWQGLKCSKDELGASAILAVQMDKGASCVLVRVTQGQEPPHLSVLFKGMLIIHGGGTSREGGQTQAGSTRLFHIRQSSSHATRAVEVDPSATFLNSNDVFVLKTPDSVFTWKGVGGTDEEMDAAKHVVSSLGGSATDVSEGEEPDDFWAALGGKEDYQTSLALKNMVVPPRLFECSNKTGRLIAVEVLGEFTQSDLTTGDIMLLDTWDQIFIWVGKDANEVEKTGSDQIAKDYVDSDPSSRSDIPIATIKQGFEPPTFTGWFQAWDPKLWETDPMERFRAQL